MSNHFCPYCNSPAKIVSNAVIYGREYGQGKVLVCTRFPKCDTYVGVFRDQTPGLMANKELRSARKLVHAEFDPLWRKREEVSRDDAYEWLGEKLGLEPQYTHIAQFDLSQCYEALDALQQGATL